MLARRVLMTAYRRIMLTCIADNPGADTEALRREFICRVLSDHPMAAFRILGQFGTQLHGRIINEQTARTRQGKRRQKFFEQRTRRAEPYRAELLRRVEADQGINSA